MSEGEGREESDRGREGGRGKRGGRREGEGRRRDKGAEERATTKINQPVLESPFSKSQIF